MEASFHEFQITFENNSVHILVFSTFKTLIYICEKKETFKSLTRGKYYYIIAYIIIFKGKYMCICIYNYLREIYVIQKYFVSKTPLPKL